MAATSSATIITSSAVPSIAGPVGTPKPAPEEEEVDEEGVEGDDELTKYYLRISDECAKGDNLQTTADMVRYSREVERCADGRIRKLLGSLPPAQRARLLSVPESRRNVAGDWYPAWHRHIDAACYVRDALTWTMGTMRMAGTMRHISQASCFAVRTVEALYWLERFKGRDAAGFARHLRTAAATGRVAKRLQAILRREAQHFAIHAPEDAEFDDVCTHFCPLYDADWRKMLRTLDALQQAAPKLGDAMCRGWPQLGRELGGHNECARIATLAMLTQAGHTSGLEGNGYYDSLARGTERDANIDRDVPPAKDADYARFVTPVYEACEHSPHSDYTSSAARTKCHETALRTELGAVSKTVGAPAARRFETKWRLFVDDLCVLEQLTNRGHYAYGPYRRVPSDHQCRWLAAARGSFLARMWSTGDVAAFRRHLAHRKPWGAKVKSGLTRLETIIKSGRCPDKVQLAGPPCRASWVPSRDWPPAEQAIKRIQPRAEKLAAELCSSWPKLANDSQRCAAELTEYFLSYGQQLALIELD